MYGCEVWDDRASEENVGCVCSPAPNWRCAQCSQPLFLVRRFARQSEFLEEWAKERNDAFPRVAEFSQLPQEKPRRAILYVRENLFLSARCYHQRKLSRQMDVRSSWVCVLVAASPQQAGPPLCGQGP